jgi:hypothetical protein
LKRRGDNSDLANPPALPRRARAKPGAFRAAADGSQNDHEAVATWLAKYADNRHTLDSYRREAERLMLWAAWHGKDLPGLMVEDVLAYKAFLSRPAAGGFVVPADPAADDA